MDISLSTGHRWNEDGCDGLYNRYSNGGRKAKLIDNQFKELDEWMHNKQGLTTRKVHKFIEERFNIKYSEKQVREIIHKIDYSYKKRYLIYSKMPEDAPITLKLNKKSIKIFL